MVSVPFVVKGDCSGDHEEHGLRVLVTCVLAWLFGTFALSIVGVADMLLRPHLDAVYYVVFVASPAITFLSSILAPVRLPKIRKEKAKLEKVFGPLLEAFYVIF